MNKFLFSRLSLRQSILGGFFVLVIVFSISAIYNFYTIQKSKKTLTVLFEEKEPSVETLSDYKLLLVRSKMLTTNWVYMRNDEYSRKELLHLQNVEYSTLVKMLKHEALFWNDKFQEEMLYEIMLKYNHLEKSQKDIQKLLVDFSSYDDATKKFTAEDILESSILPITNELTHKVDVLLEMKSAEKDKARLTMLNSFYNLLTSIVILGGILLVLGLVGSVYFASVITKPITHVKNAISSISKGEIVPKLTTHPIDEMAQMSLAVNVLLDNFNETTRFANEIGKGNFSITHSPLGENDVLGQALVQMKNRLSEVAIEESQKYWVNNGYLQFSSKLSKIDKASNHWMNELLLEIITYTQAIQGGIYIINENEDGLALRAKYALNEEQIAHSEIKFGEGLVGQVFDSKEQIKINNFQELKVDIAFLGKVIPQHVFVIPLLSGDYCYGVLMLSYLENKQVLLEQYLEEVCDAIANTYSYIHHNQKISSLLDVSLQQQQALEENKKALEAHMNQLRISEEQAIKAKEKAESAMVAKSQFLSVMSHEIRTPMNAIIGLSNLLQDADLKDDDRQHLSLLQFSAQNLLHLINEILDFSKIDSGKLILESIDFNLEDLVNNVANSQLIRAKEKGIKLDVIYDENIPFLLKGDALRLTQIFNNLLNNAVKFTEKGSISFELSLVKNRLNKATILINVKDTGIGIPEDKLSSVFENFSQASSDTTRKYGGTGLGLSITKKILKLMGSDIQLVSKVGEGTCFSFELTLDVSSMSQKAFDTLNRKDSLEHISLDKYTILLVDDNETNLMVAGQFLKRWHANFDTAINGLVAVELTRKKRYDLILMDLQMPVMDGYEASKLIRSKDKYVPIVAMTAEAVNDIKNYAYDLGINDIITKPFNPDALRLKIIQTIENVNGYEDNIEEETNPQTPIDLPRYISTTKYEDMAEDDNEFLLSLLKQTFNDYIVYKQRYELVMKNGDVDMFGKLIHKMKPTIDMLGAAVLMQELRNQQDKMGDVSYLQSKEYEDSFKLSLDIFDQVNEVLSIKIREITEKLV